MDTIDFSIFDHGAEAVQEIGRVAVIYRRAKKPRLKLPE